MNSYRLGLILLALFGGIVRTEAQSVAKNPAPTPPVSRPIDPSGYLSKTPASPLRFATPPRPPVVSLPPLAITQDPKPVFSARFVEPTADVTVLPPAAAAPSPELVTSVQWPELVSQIPAKQGGIPETLPPKLPIVRQSLVRYFEPHGPSEGTSLEIEFQVPTESKSVRREVPSKTEPQALKR